MKRTFTIKTTAVGQLFPRDIIHALKPMLGDNITVTEVKDPEVMILRLKTLSDAVQELSILTNLGDFSADWLTKQIEKITSPSLR